MKDPGASGTNVLKKVAFQHRNERFNEVCFLNQNYQEKKKTIYLDSLANLIKGVLQLRKRFQRSMTDAKVEEILK